MSNDDDFLLLILSSPSGAGKTTLKTRILEAHPELRFSVSHTTRKPRQNELDGREYHFIDKARFLKMTQAGQFAERAQGPGHLYGTSPPESEAARGSHPGGGFHLHPPGAPPI